MKRDYDKLYWFHENFGPFARGLRVNPQEGSIADPVGLLRGEVRPAKAIPFYHDRGKRVCDVIWTGFFAVLISKCFRDLLRTEGFTGWSTYPVAVHDHEGKRLRNYFGLAVTGRAGPIDDSRSKKVWRGPHFEGGPKFQQYAGMYFKNDEWDSSDLFVPKQSAFIIISDRVMNALKSLKIPNVQFDCLSTFERDVIS